MTDDAPKPTEEAMRALYASAFGPGGPPRSEAKPKARSARKRPAPARLGEELNSPAPAPATENNDTREAIPETQPSDGDPLETHGVDVTEEQAEELEAEESGDGDDERGERPPDPGPCPIKPLGRVGAVYYFSTEAGEILELKRGELFSRAGIASLFDGHTEWLQGKFPVYGRDGKIVGGAWQIQPAAEHLMRECAALPLWDTSTPLRGRGVWLVGAPLDPKSTLVVHCGDRVLVGDRWVAPGFRKGGVIYRAMPPIEPPAPRGALTEIGAALVKLLGRWKWEHANAPLVVAGWIAASMLGAAKPWNPHLLIVSAPGSGKSTLADLLERISPLSEYFDVFSVPGIRRAINEESRSVILDEAEGGKHGDGGVVQQAIELIRRMSSQKGSRGVMAGTDNKAAHFTASGSAALLAVLPPDLQPQDRTRITRLDLLPLDGQAKPEELEREIEELVQHSHALWARMLLLRSVYVENFRRFRQVLAELGRSTRLQDQAGSMLAGWATLDGDEPIALDAAKRLVRACEFIVELDLGEDIDNGPQRCLAQLLGSPAPDASGGTRRTIGQTIALLKTPADFDLVDRLAACGLKVQFGDGKIRAGIFVANRHPALSKVYDGTDWAGNKWADDLKRLPGAIPAPPMWIGGTKARSAFLPDELLPAVDDEARQLRGRDRALNTS